MADDSNEKTRPDGSSKLLARLSEVVATQSALSKYLQLLRAAKAAKV